MVSVFLIKSSTNEASLTRGPHNNFGLNVRSVGKYEKAVESPPPNTFAAFFPA